jgi:poly-gamma-glutamate synthesis protein (capsule biosynthesis protein)
VRRVADDEVRVMLAGDVMTGRGIDQAFAQSCAPELFEPWVRDAREYLRLAERVNGPIPAPITPGHVWGDALPELARHAPDARIVNLETAVTTSDRPWPGKGIHYRMHPANVGCLSAARIDCCVLANNHVMDWGREGLAQTLQTLQGAGLRATGAGHDVAAARAPAILPLRGGGRLLVYARATGSSGVPSDWAAGRQRAGVALLVDPDEASRSPAYEAAADRATSGEDIQGIDALCAQIAAERRSGDLVVVSIHWGDNWSPRVPEAHRWLARRLLDAGAADVVHGHSSHHPMPVEVWRGKLILYGCGDLINDYEGIGPHGELRSDLGCLYFVTLARATGELRDLRIVPMQLRGFRLSKPEPAAWTWLERLFGGALSRASDARPTRAWPEDPRRRRSPR